MVFFIKSVKIINKIVIVTRRKKFFHYFWENYFPNLNVIDKNFNFVKIYGESF